MVADREWHNEALCWEQTGDATVAYRAQFQSHNLTIRVGDFPGEALYTLLVDTNFATEFDDWPPTWDR